MSVSRNPEFPSSANECHIIRVAQRERYTIVNNEAIEDERLSFRALGLLTYLLSKPDHWTVRVEHLVSTHREGRDAVKGALRELEDLGYLQRIRSNDEQGHLTWESVIHEKPQVTPSTGKPSTGLPSTGNPSLVSTEVVIPDVTKTEKRSMISRADRFDEFWQAYPLKKGKDAARKVWGRLKVDPDLIIAGAIAYRDDPDRDDEYTKYPQGWLNDGRWEDELTPSMPHCRPTKTQRNLIAFLQNDHPTREERFAAAGALDALETTARPTLALNGDNR